MYFNSLELCAKESDPISALRLGDQVAIFVSASGEVSFSRFILQISNAMPKTKKFICRGHLTRDHKFVLGCFEDAFFNFSLHKATRYLG